MVPKKAFADKHSDLGSKEAQQAMLAVRGRLGGVSCCCVLFCHEAGASRRSRAAGDAGGEGAAGML